MADYKTLVGKYTKRRRDTLVDAVATGFSYADNLSVDLGLLEDTGLTSEILEAASVALPFAVIAVTEQCKVLLKKKPGKTAASDAAYRMLKTGAAMGAGAAVAAAGAPALAALPAAVTVRVLLDRYKSRAFTARRVEKRVERLRALRQQREVSGVDLLAESGEDTAV